MRVTDGWMLRFYLEILINSIGALESNLSPLHHLMARAHEMPWQFHNAFQR